jgi:hypothetical protein
MPAARCICFTEDEAFTILWVLAEALAAALAVDALASAAEIEGARQLVRSRIDENRER